MTNNQDEYDIEGMETMDADAPVQKKEGVWAGVTEAWHTRPMFKLVAIMVVVAAAIIISLNISSDSTPDVSKLARPAEINEPPGGKASPYFAAQNKMASDQRANQAMQTGESAMPTPVGRVDGTDLDNANNDPLAEFRAETERLKEELKQQQQQNAQQIQVIQQQVQQTPQQFDDSLAQAMQRQMQQLMDSWQPTNMRLVNGAKEENKPVALDVANAQGYAGGVMPVSATGGAAGPIEKLIVTAGTVNYGQLITEANSDVPGTILAQIVSGPFTGAKAVGEFQVNNDYIVLRFSLVSFKGKDYSTNILALNPNTTLGGMATEVDQRYFTRVVLPAAGSFVQAFGQTMGQNSSTQTITDGGVITTENTKASFKQGVYSGIGQMGQTLSQFLQDRANKVKPLVRIAAGTPLGMFFVTSVKETSSLQQNVEAEQRRNQMSPYYGSYNPQTFNAYMNDAMGAAQGYVTNNTGPYTVQTNPATRTTVPYQGYAPATKTGAGE